VTVIEAVQYVLENDAALAAAVAAGNIRAPGPWESLERPFIVHYPSALVPRREHGKTPVGILWSYEVSIFADTIANGEEIAALVVSALDGTKPLDSPITLYLKSQWQSGTYYMGRNDEEGVEHFALQFQISKALA